MMAGQPRCNENLKAKQVILLNEIYPNRYNRNVYQTKDIQPWSEGKVNGYVPLNIIIENFTAFYWDGIVHKFLVFLLYTAHPIYFIQLAADGTWLGSKDTNKPILCCSQV